ncbi:hypothetical protein DPMN_064653 [Dreissena polymorpha]|uniref:Uncharacterized protein n=1 Tax=Dreissena polymorpha TaxID=45954 RepID=A0A9D4CD48_DREPO|nr:hypothetical protein DPMN_064653 [Dreissena polymorpha]
MYTNYCLRAFVSSHLHKMGYSDQAILAVTGHRNSASLTSYIKPDDDERHNLSTALHFAGYASSNRCHSQKELTKVASHVHPSNHSFAITQSDAKFNNQCTLLCHLILFHSVVHCRCSLETFHLALST